MRLATQITTSSQPDSVNNESCKLRLFILTEITVWNLEGLQHWVTKISGFKYRVCGKNSYLC